MVAQRRPSGAAFGRKGAEELLARIWNHISFFSKGHNHFTLKMAHTHFTTPLQSQGTRL